MTSFFDFEVWAQALIGVLASGSLAAIGHLVREGLKRRASRQYDRGYGNIRRVFQLLQTTLPVVNANRVMILKSENGGGIPAPGTQVTSSVVNEVFDPPVMTIHEAWQQVPLDQDYSRILAEVNTEGTAHAKVDDLTRSSTLRDLLVAADCSQVFFWRICATPNALLYLSIHYSSTDESPMGERDRVEAGKVTRQLCQIFSKHHQLVKTDS